jgi:hypothetical protein
MVKMKNVCWVSVLVIVVFGGWVVAEGSEPIPGIISYWTFDEGAGEVAHDAFGNNDGSLNDPCWATGQIDGALSFDGVDDNIDLGTDSSLKMDLPVSYCAWVKILSTGSSDLIIALGHGQSQWYYGIFSGISAENRLEVHVGDGTGKSTSDRRSKKYGNTVLNLNQWYHVAVVVRGGVDMDLYVDGENDGGTYEGTGGSLRYAGANGSSFIGGTTSDIGVLAPFNGLIDDIAVFNRALNEEEIQQIYQDGLAGLGYVLDYKQIAINNIEWSISAKTEALELVNLAIEKERAAFDALSELNTSGDPCEMSPQDIFRARSEILWAMGRQFHAKFNLRRSIRKLETALRRLTLEPEPESEGPIHPERPARPRRLGRRR